MTLKDIVAAMLAEGVTVHVFLDFFTGLGMQDHPYIVEITQQLLLKEAFRNLGSPVPAWNDEDADLLMKSLASPPPPDTEWEPWSPRMEEEVIAQENMASLAQACVQDGEFRYTIFSICRNINHTFTATL